MHGLMILALLVLYLAVLRVKRPEPEPYFGVKITGLMVLSFFIFSLGPLQIPLGIFIGFWIVTRKATPNLDLKCLALFFTVVYFALSLFVPPLDLEEFAELRKKEKYMALFTSVESVTTIPPDSHLQQELRKHLRSSEDDAPILRTWILKENGIPIEDSSQIYEKWFGQNVVSESQTSTNNTTQVMYVDFRDKHYVGILKREHEQAPFRLHQVIEHNGFRPGVNFYFPW